MSLNILISIVIIFIIGLIYYKYTYIPSIQQKTKYNPLDQQKIKTKLNKNKLKHNKLKHNKLKQKQNQKQKPKDDLVFMDIGINNKPIGKIVIKLFSNIVPKTCNNFRMLCINKSYVDSPFHRIIKDFMIQGGDFTNEDGTGGKSIYGNKFEDENFVIKHNKPYLLSMANSGPNTNGSQFFITTSETPHLNGKHVVFGEVVEGFDIIDELNVSDTDGKDKPVDDIRILRCNIKQ